MCTRWVFEMGGGDFEKTVKVIQVKEKADDCSFLPGTSPPCVAPHLPSLHHLALGGFEQLFSMGGQVFPLFFLIASRCTTDSHYPGDLLPPRTLTRLSHKHKRAHTRTQAVQHANPLHSVLALSFSSSYVGLFVAAMPELAEENRENKAKTKKKKKRRVEKIRLRRWARAGAGMNETEMEREGSFCSHRGESVACCCSLYAA